MHWIGRAAARSVHHIRHVRGALTLAAQTAYRFHSQSLHNRSPTLTRALSSPVPTLGVIGFSALYPVCARAETENCDGIESGQTYQLLEDLEKDEHVESEIRLRDVPMAIVLEAVMSVMDPYQKALFCGIAGTNIAVSSAFLLGFNLNKPPNRKPALFRFMCKNFILSQGWLKQGRWHVLLTSMFTHLFARHLITNTLVGCLAILGLSPYLGAWQIAALYLCGGLIGGTASVSLSTFLRKHRYIVQTTGASDGLLALGTFLILIFDLPPQFVTHEALILKTAFAIAILRQVIGFRKFLRYGYTGKGKNKIDVDYTAHLAGALTGVAAYGMTRISRGDQTNIHVDGLDMTQKLEEVAETPGLQSEDEENSE